ncbi:MAG TPA: c-type cytochrome [Gaiellaceae bacterium]|nr:c-type cytochrome [Gaiellaceae bacterium]
MRTRAAAIAFVAALVCAATAAAASGPSPQQVQQGKSLYGRYCLSCHGMNGSGVAPSRVIGAGPGRDQEQQNAVAPPLRGVGARAADFYLRTGYMPLQKLGLQPRRSKSPLSPSQMDALIAYIASLGKGPPVPKPQPARGNLSEGMQLFTANCAGCHQIVAEGGYVTGAVPPPLEDDSSTQIAEAVRIGPFVMPTFSEKQISDRQLDSIIAYVQYAKHPDDRGGWAIGHLGPVPEGLVAWFIAAVALVAVCMVIGKRLTSH